MSARRKLSEAQINRAFRLFYGDGLPLRGVMQELGVGLYELSPWLTAPALRIAEEAVRDERQRIASAGDAAQPDRREGADHV